MLQIGHLLDASRASFRAGQRQRVAMGRALVRNPQSSLRRAASRTFDAKLRVDIAPRSSGCITA